MLHVLRKKGRKDGREEVRLEGREGGRGRELKKEETYHFAEMYLFVYIEKGLEDCKLL